MKLPHVRDVSSVIPDNTKRNPARFAQDRERQEGSETDAGAEAGAEGEPARVAGQPIEPARSYRVVVPDFLLTGRERGLDFLTRDAPGVERVTELVDVRVALLAELERRWPAVEAVRAQP